MHSLEDVISNDILLSNKFTLFCGSIPEVKLGNFINKVSKLVKMSPPELVISDFYLSESLDDVTFKLTSHFKSKVESIVDNYPMKFYQWNLYGNSTSSSNPNEFLDRTKF